MTRRAGWWERAKDFVANAGRAGKVAAAGSVGGRESMRQAAQVSDERYKAKLTTEGERVKDERIAYCEACDLETVLADSDLLHCGECGGDAVEIWR